MRKAFVDTAMWIDCIYPRGSKLDNPRAFLTAANATFVTSELVIFELLNYFSDRGRLLRESAVIFVDYILNEPSVEIVSLSSQQFRDALKLFRARGDKGWSLTDCASMELMRGAGIDTIYTLDHHFVQAGFIVLPEAAG